MSLSAAIHHYIYNIKGTVSQMSYNLLVHFVNNKHIILLNEVLEISTTIKVEVLSVIS